MDRKTWSISTTVREATAEQAMELAAAFRQAVRAIGAKHGGQTTVAVSVNGEYQEVENGSDE